MTDKKNEIVKKHLSRNVPIDFMAYLEGERFALAGGLSHRARTGQKPRFAKMVELLGIEPSDDTIMNRLNSEITEIQLRYLVLSKSLDRSVPPTPAFRALQSLTQRAQQTLSVLDDPDRDEIVCHFIGLQDDDPVPATLTDFLNANSLAERMTIAHRLVEAVTGDLEEMTRFFDYKAGMMPKGPSTQFAMAYAISALADLFERENMLGRKAGINMGIRLNSENDQGEWLRYTGVFLNFMTEFFHRIDDGQLTFGAGNSLADRMRKLTKQRRKDPEIFKLLDGDVSVEDVLEFMRRVEEAK